MKRRKFFKNMGLGIGSGLLTSHIPVYKTPHSKYTCPGIKSLIDATNEQGELALRFALINEGLENNIHFEISIKVKGRGYLSRTKSYFLEPPDQQIPQQEKLNSHLHPGDIDILVAWIKEVKEETTIQIKIKKKQWEFVLSELLEKGELEFQDDYLLTVNFLGYNEIGKIDLSALSIQDKDSFRFAIMADPQGGNPETPKNEAPTRIKIHNAFIEDTVARINELKPVPVFTLILGDFVDSIGQEGNFLHMEELVKPLKMPVLLELGNHETPYNADFTPAYNMSDLDNFFSSQKRINGIEKILYSFNLGKWHFIVWPDPLRQNFWATHPHYFDWLEKELEQNKQRPVLFLHHVPLHPIGIDPLTTYVESISVKRLLIDILAKHGNVKYAFSGHVHIPLKASLKTAINYKGIRMINLPAAGFRPRAFGEPDFFGGPEQGVCILDIKGEELSVHFQHVTKEWFTYPKELPEFNDKKFALWFNQPWELPLRPKLVNGIFSKDLEHWHHRFVYHEDDSRSNICEIKEDPDQNRALYLYSRKRDYDVPGQDRLPQHINRIAQAVSLRKFTSPVLEISYRPEKGHFNPKSLNGFFIWLECFNQSYNVTNLIYSVGKVYGNITKSFGNKRKVRTYHFDLASEVGQWHNVSIPFAKDFTALSEKGEFTDLQADRVVIYLGTWTVNEGIDQEAGVFIKKVALVNEETTVPFSRPKNENDIWYNKIDHIAGEHKYVSQTMVYPKGLQGEK